MKNTYNTGKLAFYISKRLNKSIYLVIRTLDLFNFKSPQELTKEEVVEWTRKVNEILNN